MSYKRKTVYFNMENEKQKELYEWCTSERYNFSMFIRNLLSMYKDNKVLIENKSVNDLSVLQPTEEDKMYMNDIL
ncbi:hypothetical protein [Chengkuizengella sediminis]|uniref:hypothetical protein n=1 Tax=Chengkuizengella sediminis TaxID=1885917 RepID=UPI001389A8C4|nr:hypothetical protein [Chengkuizengella sediminis]NDI36602.1 hypothetical protein [Chengkuizengella sediminis]